MAYFLDVVCQIKNIVYSHEARLTTEERNMLSVAYKNITNKLRHGWRVIDSLETSMKSSRQKPRHLVLIRQEKARIEQELADACKGVVGVYMISDFCSVIAELLLNLN